MYEWITITAYPWIKALHVIAVISWMAGMLYLPRLFVYHCEAEVGSKQSETFKVMEWRLLKAIINPAMMITWLAGLYLAWSARWITGGSFAEPAGAALLSLHRKRVSWRPYAADEIKRLDGDKTIPNSISCAVFSELV